MTCHNCRSNCQRFGKHRNGLQRFRCNQCGKTYTEAHERESSAEIRLNEDATLLALRMICEGMSIRAASRITGIHHRSLIQSVLAAGERCERLLAERVKGIPVQDVQADEIWAYVGKKGSHVGPGDPWNVGDAWCFVAIERNTKMVMAFELGKRTITSATRFITKLALATDPEQRFQLTTDGLNAYPYPVGNILGDRVDYSQLVKIYNQQTPEEMRRYSPARLAEAHPTPVYGNPVMERVSTSHIERQNLTMRMCVRRLTRLTNAFSKKWDNLKAGLALHFAFYNFVRPHQSLRGATPAMKAGITDRAWTLAEVLA